MLLRFTKMHGLGNDFMVLDLISQQAHIQPRQVRLWSDRHTGVGFDQLLIDGAATLTNASAPQIGHQGAAHPAAVIARLFQRTGVAFRLENGRVILI